MENMANKQKIEIKLIKSQNPIVVSPQSSIYKFNDALCWLDRYSTRNFIVNFCSSKCLPGVFVIFLWRSSNASKPFDFPSA
ncbi:hypothetical protein H5410_030323 [Solanum commersonii]|uniref:Uncharacterized protein n=1 Tax=Solanum commersonii TaxID=4109 RepID=A0A9J5YFC1_SOLCO|nr:hypothetical protein H5410_030323 [Solanum commersonii]